MKRRLPRKDSKGFSLIELSAVISIAAAVTVGYLSWTQPKEKSFADNTRLTQARLRTISAAIEAFKVKYGRLPCPADPFKRSDGSSAPGAPAKEYDSEYGMEDLDVVDTDEDGTLGIDCPRHAGMVPAYSLELSEDYFLDGWNRRFAYQVSKLLCGADVGTTNGLTAAVSRNKGCTAAEYAANAGDIVIEDAKGNRLKINAAYAVVSHGRNGYGAFLSSGARVAFPAEAVPAEAENADAYSLSSPATFNPDHNVYIAAERVSDGGYDDIVFYRTRAQIETLTRDESRKLLKQEKCDEYRDLIASDNFGALLDQGKTDAALNAAMQKGTSNPGDAALLMLMDSLQRLCGEYYQYTASDYRCPKNAQWDDASKTCQCAGGDWDNCQE
jgi:prepilin-type N-terminal cleavage/methylation domain-containing protein